MNFKSLSSHAFHALDLGFGVFFENFGVLKIFEIFVKVLGKVLFI